MGSYRCNDSNRNHFLLERWQLLKKPEAVDGATEQIQLGVVL